MMQRFGKSFDSPAFLRGSFAVLITTSPMCSVSGQGPLSVVPVSDPAAAIQPWRAGNRAPGFVVETVTNQLFEFDPKRLERPVILLVFRGGWCPFCNL